MMQFIREKAQGIIAWVIVAMIIIVFCFWGVSGYFSNQSSPALATVNGKEITSLEVEEMYNRWLRFAAAQPNFDLGQINPQDIKQQILQSIVEQEALTSSLTKDGFWISDDTLISSIRANEIFQQDGKFSPELYVKYMRQLNLDETTYEQANREELLLNQVQLGVIVSSFTLPVEAERLLAIRNQKRDFGYALIPLSNYLNAASVTDAQIEEFYNKNAARFMAPEKVKLLYVELSLDDLMQDIKPSDQQLQDFYKQNIQTYSNPLSLRISHIMLSEPSATDAQSADASKAKIDAIYKQLQSGANFGQLAKQQSDDKYTAAKGGDLGWINSNDDYPAAVFALKKDGEYTQPIKIDNAWHIFQLNASQGGGVKSFESVRNVVLERYKREQAERLFSERGSELANMAYENPHSLDDVSKKLNLSLRSTDYFTKEGGAGIAASPNVVRAAFSEPVLVQQNNSDLIKLNDDNYAVVRVSDKQPQRQLELSEVRADIIKMLKSIQAREKTKEFGTKVLAELKNSTNPTQVARNNKLQWQNERNVDRNDRSVDQSIRQQAFVMTKPKQGQSFTTNGFSLPNGDYVVMALTGVTEGKLMHDAEDSSLLDMLAKQMNGYEGRLEYMCFQAALVDQAKVKYTQMAKSIQKY